MIVILRKESGIGNAQLKPQYAERVEGQKKKKERNQEQEKWIENSHKCTGY